MKLIDKKDIIIISTEDKISRLDCLRVDTGDIEIDNKLQGFVKVITGYKTETLIDMK